MDAADRHKELYKETYEEKYFRAYLMGGKREELPGEKYVSLVCDGYECINPNPVELLHRYDYIIVNHKTMRFSLDHRSRHESEFMILYGFPGQGFSFMS